MKILILIPLILVALIYNVDALAVASDYLVNDTLELIEGTSKLHGIRIQNPTNQEMTVKLVYDTNFLSVLDYQNEYVIPPKDNYKIFFNVTAKNVKPDETYNIGYTVHQLSGGGSGVPILIKIGKSFKLKVIRIPNKIYVEDYYPHISYAALGLVFSFLLYRKKFRKGKNFGKIKFKKRKLNKRKA